MCVRLKLTIEILFLPKGRMEKAKKKTPVNWPDNVLPAKALFDWFFGLWNFAGQILR
jgi:hypothetical protein